MKTCLSITTALLITAFATASLFAEEPAANCPMCEKMKISATEANAKVQKDLLTQAAEIDGLVVKMNGSIGAERLEALTAIVTRLAEQNKALVARLSPILTAKPSTEAHEH